MLIQCQVCSQEFEPRTGNQKCCSANCFKQYRDLYSKQRYAEKKRLNRRDAVCITCKKEFNYHYRPERGKRHFCGRSCASKFYIADGTYDRWRTQVNPRPKIPRVVVGCSLCKSEIPKTEKWLFRKFHFCNMSCRNEYFRLHPTMQGKKLKPESVLKQKATLAKNHPGVQNAFELAQHRHTSKPQIQIFEFLSEEFKDYEFELEQYVKPPGIFADIISKRLNLIVEFYGDYWHCNPATKHGVDPDWVHHKKRQTAREIWEQDARRNLKLEEAGYKVVVVWESDMKCDWQRQVTEAVNLVLKKEKKTV